MLEVRETRLPGVGTKFTLRTTRGEKVSSVVHLDGMREIYHWSDADEEPHVLTLNDEEARQLGAIIGGVVYRPQYEHYGNYVPTVLPLRYDAFLHIDQTTAVRPLFPPLAEEVEEEMPETFPTGV